MTLKQRCSKFLSDSHKDDPVGDLLSFVLSERGRSAHETLDDAAALCLYFATPGERDAFVEKLSHDVDVRKM